jgi:CDP-diacylglycerol--glycerol-3-phosphate 3-phosphatidyltransferase
VAAEITGIGAVTTILTGLWLWWAVGRWSALAMLGIGEGVVLAYLLGWARRFLPDLRRVSDDTPLPSLGLANRISVLRMYLIPAAAVGVLLLPADAHPGWRWSVLLALVLVVLSDLVDGPIARARGEVSRFGTFLDPIADSFGLLVLSLALGFGGLFPMWFAAIVVLRVVYLVLGGVWVTRYGYGDRMSLEILVLGRPSVVAVLICMMLAVVLWTVGLFEAWQSWFVVLCGAVALLTVASIVEKFWLFFRLMGASASR